MVLGILWELYASFFLVGLFCVGGGYASVPLIQTQVIDIHGWLTVTEFMDIFAISQMTPGPIGINAATFVGTKVAGLPGALAATFGFVTPSMIIMTFLAWLFEKYGSLGAVRGILNGLRPAVVALIGGAALVFAVMAVFGDISLHLDLGKINFCSVAVIAAAYIAVKLKVFGVIQTLVFSGLLGLLLNSLRAML